VKYVCVRLARAQHANITWDYGCRAVCNAILQQSRGYIICNRMPVINYQPPEGEGNAEQLKNPFCNGLVKALKLYCLSLLDTHTTQDARWVKAHI